MLIDLLIAASAALLAAVAGLPVTSGVLRLAAREDGAGENDLGEETPQLEGERRLSLKTHPQTTPRWHPPRSRLSPRGSCVVAS